jgi:hypothetical protein
MISRARALEKKITCPTELRIWVKTPIPLRLLHYMIGVIFAWALGGVLCGMSGSGVAIGRFGGFDIGCGG